MDFMGLELTKIDKGDLKIINHKRLYDVLMVNRHNHLRLTRIIACLSMVGFRHYAVKLIHFLHDICNKDKRFKDNIKLC
jgi:hypothetical protein